MVKGDFFMRKKRKQRITIELVLAEEDETKAIEYALEHAKELYKSGRLHVKAETIGRNDSLQELIADVMSHSYLDTHNR